MTVKSFSFEVDTQGYGDILNITEILAEQIGRSDVTDGIAVIFSPSSTSGLTTLEFESGCVEDMKAYFERVTPSDADYRHNLRWGDGNGFSHLRASLLGPSLTIPVQGGQLILGTWQQVILVDFDNRPRRRKLIMQLVGA